MTNKEHKAYFENIKYIYIAPHAEAKDVLFGSTIV